MRYIAYKLHLYNILHIYGKFQIKINVVTDEGNSRNET